MHHHLSQIKYRINEGNGQAIYVLGVNDTGTVIDLTDQEKIQTLTNFKKLVNSLNYELTTFLNCNYKKRQFFICKITNPLYESVLLY